MLTSALLPWLRAAVGVLLSISSDAATLLQETPSTRFTAASFAPAPAEDRGLARDEVRLLVGTPDGLEHARFRDLPEHLAPGDVLVVNTSATVPGEVDAVVEGRDVVLHVAHDLGGGSVVVELRTAPDALRAVLDAAAGAVVQVGDVRLVLGSPWPTGLPSSPTGRGNRLWRASVRGDLSVRLAAGALRHRARQLLPSGLRVARRGGLRRHGGRGPVLERCARLAAGVGPGRGDRDPVAARRDHDRLGRSAADGGDAADAPRAGRPGGAVEAEVERLASLGATVVSSSGRYVVLADPDGVELDLRAG